MKTDLYRIEHRVLTLCPLRYALSTLEGEVNPMTQWKCSNCAYTFGADTVPERCPSCKQACTFSDVTCYVPDCGGPGNIDPRLMEKTDKPINK
jgi:rubredoxin